MPRRPVAPPEDLHDELVRLRLRRESDALPIAEGQQDPEVLRWLGEDPVATSAPAAGVERARMQWRTGQGAPFVIADSETEQALGQITLTFTGEDSATLAYLVHAPLRGIGIAPRAVRLVSAWALEELRLARVTIEADARNTASVRVAQKAGFRPAADAAAGPAVVYELVRPPDTLAS